ncbi:MAG: nucleotidyl transferase AbiEii/AbiGii toxin family protein [Neisseria sp.]|nr:nucleotidyl transferase AbiEii/AbiGii toxin family protein [Neisseria sp.]
MTFHFEIHLTVETDHARLEHFEQICRESGGKALLIELPHGIYTSQPMLSAWAGGDGMSGALAAMAVWEKRLTDAGFPVIRRKVEIPADEAARWLAAFPHTASGGYFEWHGKVRFREYHIADGMNSIISAQNSGLAHLSRNALRGSPNCRFLTVRHYGGEDTFRRKVQNVLDWTATVRDAIELIKSQYEYCVYDDKTELDKGWTPMQNTEPLITPLYREEYPGLPEEGLLELCAGEAFIRRSALAGEDFMLKGSYLTRQYFPKLPQRLPGDLDFVYLPHLSDSETAERKFSKWVQAVTTMDLRDGVYFTPFEQNRFWRMIDYAMSEDFPTVNTDLVCTVDGKPVELYLDISFNLDIPATVPLTFRTPVEDVYLPHTVPLFLQIAWKMHQSLVRPRVKDLYDLIYLAGRTGGDVRIVDDAMQALADECARDKIPEKRIREFLLFKPEKLMPQTGSRFSADLAWKAEADHLRGSTCPGLPQTFEELHGQFVRAMRKAGFSRELSLPPPGRGRA